MPKEFVKYFRGNIDVIHPIACGIDVHSKFLVAVICIHTDPTKNPKYFKKRFSLFTGDLRCLLEWLKSFNCYYVCMESTGVYWCPVYNILEEEMSEVRIVNPKWVKAVKGEKDDTKDAAWICNKYRLGETRGSYIPNRTIRELRSYQRLKVKYIQARAADKNRIINVLTKNNYKLDMVFSSVHGVSSTKIINLILSDEPYTDEDVLKCVHRRCRASSEDILKAVDGIEMTSTEKARLQIIQKHIESLNDLINELDEKIDELLSADEYQPYIEWLCTIPGIKLETAKKIIAEIGIDMSVFSSASKLSLWAGLAPGRNESAGVKHNVHVTKGGKYLKPILVEAAWAAVKSKDPYYRTKYEILSQRIGKKRAIVAIARKILVSIWHMFTQKEPWSPKDANEDHVPMSLSQRRALSRLNAAACELEALGLGSIRIISEDTGEILNG